MKCNFKLQKQELFLAIASVVAILTVFSPWVSVSAFGMSSSVFGFNSLGGWLVIIGNAVVIGMLRFREVFKAVEQYRKLIIAGVGGMTIIVGLYVRFIALGGTLSLLTRDIISFRIGLYLMMLAGAATIALLFILPGRIAMDGEVDVNAESVGAAFSQGMAKVKSVVSDIAENASELRDSVKNDGADVLPESVLAPEAPAEAAEAEMDDAAEVAESTGVAEADATESTAGCDPEKLS